MILALVVGTGCLSAPPDSKAGDDGADAGDDGADAGDPCAGVPPEFCTFFTCSGSDSCYLSCLDETPYQTANEICSGSGRKMLETETIEELACTQAYNAQELWIGLVQGSDASEVYDDWVWLSTGQPPLSYLWGQDEPNDNLSPEDNEEDCAVIALATGKWRDVPCDTTTASIVCEIAPE